MRVETSAEDGYSKRNKSRVGPLRESAPLLSVLGRWQLATPARPMFMSKRKPNGW